MLSFPRKKYWDSGFCEGGTLSFQECMGDRFSKDFQKQDVQCMICGLRHYKNTYETAQAEKQVHTGR